MSTQDYHAEAESLAQAGHPDDEIRVFLQNIDVAPYEIELIIQDLTNRYPDRKRQRPFDWEQTLLYLGGGIALLFITWIVASGSGFLFFAPLGLGGFLILIGLGKIFGKRE